MKLLDDFDKVMWLIFVAIVVVAVMFLVADTGYSYSEEITDEGGTISITGTLTPAEREAEDARVKARIEAGDKLVQGEIDRRHSLAVESAKFQNALLLERAGAARISVNASTSLTLENTNQNTNN